MYEFCHRCQQELPGRLPGAEAPLFCPHCSAPQIRLPEHMRVPVELTPDTTTAAPPPPTAQQGIAWKTVLPTAAWVALVGGLLSVLGQKIAFADYISPLWVLASGSVVLGVYLRRLPQARMSGLAGWRIGLVTGLLLIGAKGIGLSAVGVVARFATHSMAAYDVQSEKDAQAGRALAFSVMPAEKNDPVFMDKYERMLASPEVRAGSMLSGAAMQAGFILLFAGLGGLFSGAVEKRRRLVVGRG